MNYEEYQNNRKAFYVLIEDVVTNIDRLLEIVKYMGEVDRDDELAHRMEDEVRSAYLRTLSDPVAKKVLSSSSFHFSRWCA